jgi:integration host factor subunit beta
MNKKNVTKKEIVHEIAEEGSFDPILVTQVVQAFLDKITKKLGANQRLEFRDFGVFETIVRKEKLGRNPKTGVEKPIPRHITVKFKVGQKMHEAMQELTTKHPELLLESVDKKTP